jgi:hypothetical protein
MEKPRKAEKAKQEALDQEIINAEKAEEHVLREQEANAHIVPFDPDNDTYPLVPEPEEAEA